MSESDKKEWGRTNITRIYDNDVDGKKIKKEDVGKVLMTVRLGERQPNGTINTCLTYVLNYAHELSHSVSERYASRSEIGIREDALGEVESLFMEKLFLSYVKKHSEEIAKYISPMLEARNVEEQIESLTKRWEEWVLNLPETLLNSEYNPDNPYQQRKDIGYLVGEAFGSLFFEEYKKNPEKAIEQYAKYLENNTSMSINDCSKVLFDDKNMTIENVIKNFTESLDKKTQKIKENQEERSM